MYWKDKLVGQWKKKNVFLEKNKEVLNTKLWAVSKALHIAKKRVNIVNKLVIIFYDLQKVPKVITFSLTYQKNRLLQDLIYQKVQKL